VSHLISPGRILRPSNRQPSFSFGFDNRAHDVKVSFGVTRSEYIRLLQNPYAELQVDEEPEGRHRALSTSQNPYATYYYLGDPEVATHERTNPELTEAATQDLTAKQFERESRAILKMYLPVGQRNLRTEHVRFIDEGKKRSPGQRAIILERLKQYDLRKFGKLNPQLNRERSEQLEKKLEQILGIAGQE
jgi:hypothetical protein